MLRLVVAGLLLVLGFAGGFAVSASKTVTLTVDGTAMRVSTMKSRVIDIVQENGFSVDERDDLYPAALATASGMDLGFYHYALGAFFKEPVRGFFGFSAGQGHLAARHGHAILRKNCFCLVLVNFHLGFLVGVLFGVLLGFLNNEAFLQHMQRADVNL